MMRPRCCSLQVRLTHDPWEIAHARLASNWSPFLWERHTRYSWARVIITSCQSSSSPSPASDYNSSYEVHYIYRSAKSLHSPHTPGPRYILEPVFIFPSSSLKKQSAWTKPKFLSFFRLRVHPSCIKRKFRSISSFHITSHYIQTQTRILPIASVVCEVFWNQGRQKKRKISPKKRKKKGLLRAEIMETAEPVSYDFHGVGAFPHRRAMDSPLYPYYSHPTSASYLTPFHAPNPPSYHFGSLNHQQSHPYHYVVASQPPLGSSRLTEQPPLLPEIRPAKNAISQVGKPETSLSSHLAGLHKGSSSEKKDGPSAEFSTEVDVLMKAIQAKPSTSSSPVQQSLPPLQQLAPPGYPSYSMSPPQCLLTNEGQLSRSGKKRKYTCTLPNCGKSFAQKTHLDIHTRAHTGDKPFVSKSCNLSPFPSRSETALVLLSG